MYSSIVPKNGGFLGLGGRAKKPLGEGAPAHGGRQSTIVQPSWCLASVSTQPNKSERQLILGIIRS